MKNRPFPYNDGRFYPLIDHFDGNPDIYGYYDDDLYYSRHNDVMSMTECTGLTSTIPTDEAEVESYNDIYDIPLEPHEKSER